MQAASGWMGVWFQTQLWCPPRLGMGIGGFMFHDMLYWHSPLSLSRPDSSLVHTANVNPIYPMLTALYYSPFSCFLVSRVPAFSLLSPCIHASLTFVLHLTLLALLCWKGTVLFPQQSWWRGVCSSCYGGLTTCFRHITTFISMHEGNKGCSQTLNGGTFIHWENKTNCICLICLFMMQEHISGGQPFIIGSFYAPIQTLITKVLFIFR